MSESNKFRGLLVGISVLPALIVCGARAQDASNKFTTVANNDELVINAGEKYQGCSSDVGGIGGAIAVSKPGGEVKINGNADNMVEFIENSATYDGGAIGNYGKISASYVKFMGNKSQLTSDDTQPIGGGAISLGTDSQTELTHAIFKNNETGYNGGAISTRRTLQENEKPTGNKVDSNYVKISDSEFIGNKANGTTTDRVDGKKVGGYGGAIANTFETTEISGSSFTGNEAKHGGGAVYLTGFLTANKGGIGGGEKTGKGGKITITDSVFTENTSFQGGAILSGTSAQELMVNAAQFINNTANVGGGAIWSGAKTDISNSIFTGNKTTGKLYEDDMLDDNAEGGAAIFVGSSSHTNIKGTIFKNNESGTVGGAIATRSNSSGKTSSLTIENSTFMGNHAKISGGAINIASANENVVFKGDNIFTGNTADKGADIFNNGKITIADGTTTIDGGIAGTGTLNIANASTLNIGDATIEQSSIILDGTMIANLTTRDGAIFTTDAFTGGGKLSLIAKSAGEYNVFGNAAFDNVSVDSAMYNVTFDDAGTVTLAQKSAQEIASDNALGADVAQTVLNLANSSSDALNNLAVSVQESLAAGDAAAVENAHRAINPADVALAQSVASSIQGTVSKLAANRMSLPAIGRAGGDADMTAGGVWAQGLFNKSKKNGEFNGYTRGVAAGIDGTIGRAFTIGAGYAFGHSDVDMASRDTEIDSNTVFVYGQYKPADWYVNAMLNYTMSDYTENANALGVAIDSDYKVNSFGGEILTGYDFAGGITPELGVRYLHIDGDDYTNSLGIRNKVQSADYLTAIAGAKYGAPVAVSDSLTLRPELRAAVKYDLMSDDYSIAVAMPGIDSYGLRADRLNRFGGEAGIGITMTYKDVDVSLNYDIEVRQDYTSQTGMVRARYNF